MIFVLQELRNNADKVKSMFDLSREALVVHDVRYLPFCLCFLVTLSLIRASPGWNRVGYQQCVREDVQNRKKQNIGSLLYSIFAVGAVCLTPIV